MRGLIPSVPTSAIYIVSTVCYDDYTGGTGPSKRGAFDFSLHQILMTIKTSDLVSLGSIAAEAFDEFDTAQTHLNDSFGVPYSAAKDNLLRDVTIAETEGLDLSIFAGSDSRFRFPTSNTNIVIRIHKKPTAHTKLEKLAAKVARCEQDLKLAKMALKHETEHLIASGSCDELTDRIVLAFTRMK